MSTLMPLLMKDLKKSLPHHQLPLETGETSTTTTLKKSLIDTRTLLRTLLSSVESIEKTLENTLIKTMRTMRNLQKNLLRTGISTVRKLKPTSMLLLEKLDKHGNKLMLMLHKTSLLILRQSDKTLEHSLIALVPLLSLLETPSMVKPDNNTKLTDKLTELNSST